MSTIVKVWCAENLLFSLAFFAIFLPPAAQSIVSGLVILHFLLQKRWRVFSRAGWRRQPFWVFGLFVAAAMPFTLLSILCSGWWHNPDLGFPKVFGEGLRLVGKQGVYGLLMIAAIWSAFLRGWRVRWVEKNLLIFLILHLGYLVWQRYTGIDLVHGWDAVLPGNRYSYGIFRASGFMAHPLSLAYNVMLFSLLAYSLAFSSGSFGLPVGRRKLWLGIFSLSLVTLFLTGSRWPLFLVFLVIGLFEARRLVRYWRILIPVFAIVLLFFYFERQTWSRFTEVFTQGEYLVQRVPRVAFWQVHWEMFTDHPLFGVGYWQRTSALLDYYNKAGYTGIETKYSAHNIFLQVLADSGLVGFIGLVLIFLGVLHLARQAKQQIHHNGLYFILCALLLSGLMQNTLRDSEHLYCIWLILVSFWLFFFEDHRDELGKYFGYIKDTDYKPGKDSAYPLQDERCPP